MINIKNLDPNNIKIDEKPYNNILIYRIGYVIPNSVKPLHLITNIINGYIEEYNGNKYLALVQTDESKDALKKYEELPTKIKDLIRSTSNSSDNYDENYMKIGYNSDDLPQTMIALAFSC